MAREIETKCIHLEEEENSINHYGAISYPIYQSATYAHPGVGQSTGYDYSRLQNPTREHLEKTVASLENGIFLRNGSDHVDDGIIQTGRSSDRGCRFVWWQHPSI